MRFTVLSALLFVAMVAGKDTIISPPEGTEQGAPVAVIFLQGAQIPTDRYTTIARQIQTMVAPTIRLWVAAPGSLLDAPNPLQTKGIVEAAVAQLEKDGFPATAPFFMAGHSLGAVSSMQFCHDEAKYGITRIGTHDVAGQILWGGFIGRKYQNESSPYPTPTLTLGGELDGLARMTRFAEEFHRQQHLRIYSQEPVSDFPVVVLEGVTHMQFASGPAPFLVAKRDLRPEVTDDEAHERIAAVSSLFLLMHSPINHGDAARATGEMNKEVKRTEALVEAQVDAMLLEGSYHFKPPCYNDAPSDKCILGSPWTEKAQLLMGDIDESQGVVADEYHPVYQIPVHLPGVDKECELGAKDCRAELHTVSENKYESLDGQDTGFVSVSAYETKAKLSSRQRVQIAIGKKDTKFEDVDEVSICADINRKAYEWALEHAGDKARARFEKHGIPMVFGEDKGPYNVGPLWIWKFTQYNRKNIGGKEVLEVVAPMMRTPAKYYISAAAGFHYCKLMTPFRALEWILVDGLRDHYSINAAVENESPAGLRGSIFV